MVLIGDSVVGKSNLSVRYAKNKFDSKHEVTVGVEHEKRILQIGDKTIRADVWDTAGHERFAALITP